MGSEIETESEIDTLKKNVTVAQQVAHLQQAIDNNIKKKQQKNGQVQGIWLTTYGNIFHMFTQIRFISINKTINKTNGMKCDTSSFFFIVIFCIVIRSII